MRIYYPEKQEPLLIAWYYDLKQNDGEFSNLFRHDLRRLGPFLHWAEHHVRIMYETGSDGMIVMAAWVTPLLDGAEFGSWIRADARGSIKAVAFIRRCYRAAFETFPVLIGITCQPQLHDLHLALGYQPMEPPIPDLFDGKPARVYVLTRENYLERWRIKVGRRQQQQHVQSTGEHPEPVREERAADSEGIELADRRGAENGRSERGNPDSQSQPRRRKKRFFDFLSEHPTIVGP